VPLEKAKTTPGSYPMTVNAIVAGCKQKNNREPVTVYDDNDVEKSLTELQRVGVVKEIDWLGRVPKYKHQAYEWFGVRPVELAVLTELMLRGAQTLGELRARAARMEPIADLAALKPVVETLLERRLMIELTPPGRGQIVSHNLYPPAELEELRARLGTAAGGAAATRSARSSGPTLGHGKICSVELPALDVARSAEFYRAVFGWNVRRRGDGSTAFDDGVGEVSGSWITGRQPAMTPGLLLSVMVDSIAATLEAVIAHGGEVVEPAGADAPGMTARFRDPAGNVIGLVQPEDRAAQE
jgi:predicted enzyme related to lactoylglutathione lyase